MEKLKILEFGKKWKIENGKIKKKETLAVIVLISVTIKRGMDILGVSLPEKM